MLRGHEKPPELMKVEVMKVLPYISEREEVDILIKECCDPEDDDGFIPYEREFSHILTYNIEIDLQYVQSTLFLLQS